MYFPIKKDNPQGHSKKTEKQKGTIIIKKGNSSVPFPVREELSALPRQNSPELLGIRWHLYLERIQQNAIFSTQVVLVK